MDEFRNHIIQHPEKYSQCIGCVSCELMCGLLRDGVTGPNRGRLQVELDDYRKLHHRVLTCQQCADHPCYDACPLQGEAMCLDEELGIAYVNEEACIGCGACAEACKFTPSRIMMHPVENKAKKCDLCRTRPEGPVCVEQCPVRCLGLSDDPLPYTINEEGEVKAK